MFKTVPKVWTALFIIAALVIIPVTVLQIQQQQEIRQHAESVLWNVGQSASTSCPIPGNGVDIKVTFSNSEPNQSSTAMTVTATDQQTGKTVDFGSIKGGQTVNETIHTGRSTLNAGTVLFKFKWTDGHFGSDTSSASYQAVRNCIAPTSTPTPEVTLTPTITPTIPPGVTPSTTPTPTICPTLGPVKNVHIECPNCP